MTSGFSREISKVGRVLGVLDQEPQSRVCLARFGVAEPNFSGFSREIKWLLDRAGTAQSGGRWSHLSS